MENAWLMYRSLTRDSSIKDKTVSRALVKRILTYARPYKVIIGFFLFTLVIASVMSVAQPLLFRRIVDQGITPGDAAIVTWTAILIALLAIGDSALGLVSRYFSARIGEGLIFDLRTQVYEHVQSQSLAFFTRAQTGKLISRLNSDVIGAQQAFTSTLGGVIGNFISLTIVLITMFFLSWQITLASLILVPLFLLPARYMGRRLQTMTRESMSVNAEMSNQMTERFNVAGALLVKLFGRPREESESFSDKAAVVRDVGIRIAMANRWFFTALTLVAALATAMTYGLGGNLVIQGSITLGTLLALVGLLAQLYGPLTALSNVRIDVMTALVSFDRVFEILDLQPLVKDPVNPVQLPQGPLDVEFDHVSFRYPSADQVSLESLSSEVAGEFDRPEEEILSDISFTSPEGTLTALVGPSGAGKTTITALLARLYDPTEGEVRVGNVDISRVLAQDLRDCMGVVTQDSHLFHDTIRANLLYARPHSTDAEIEKACVDAQIWPMIKSLPAGLDTVVGDRGYRLSGGEKQRIALARLLLKSPRIVILDEATAHLDSESERLVHQALDNALSGRTSIVIAHRLSTIRNAHQILVVVAGKIVERGTHEELLANGTVYSELYRTQFAESTES
jgi:ATP-binding cassette subfamily B protein